MPPAKPALYLTKCEHREGVAKLIGQVKGIANESSTRQDFAPAEWFARWINEPAPALGGVLPADPPMGVKPCPVYSRRCNQGHMLELSRRTVVSATSKTEPSLPDGSDVLSCADGAESDAQVRAQFLAILAKDIADHPERIQRIAPDLLQRIDDLVGHIVLGDTLEQKLARFDRSLHGGEAMASASVGLEKF